VRLGFRSRERSAPPFESAWRYSEPGDAPRYGVPCVNAFLRLTIVYEPGEEDWFIASIPEVPGTHSQGQTREEARANG
jgi:hypothetical protein